MIVIGEDAEQIYGGLVTNFGCECITDEVSDEFVRRQQEAESPQTAPTEDLCATQIQRLHRVVELLELLAQAGLPTLLSTYYRSGDFTKHHNTFHGHPSRVGNWNLSLTGSLLCPHLRGIYNNVETFGSFMESFTVCNAQKKHRPAWYGNFSLLVQLIAKMMDTCTPATYDAMKWKSNPAEFIHVIRTHEVAPAPNPGEAGADNLRHLLYDTAPDVDSPPAPDPAPETPATETWIPETPPPETLPLQLMNKPMAEQTVDSSSSHSEDVKMLTQREPTHPAAAPPPDQAHKLIGGHRVRPPPSPPSRSGSSVSVVEETGTAYWMRKNGTPKRAREYVDMGDLLRAPRFWNQWITEAEVIDVIHHNQKNRFEVAPAPNPGEAGADNLRHLLYGTAPDVDSPPTPDPAPETPATETWIPETPPPEMLPLQLMNKPMAEQTVDSSSSHSEDVKMLTQRSVAAPPPDQAHKLIGGHRVRTPPSPPSRSGSSASVVEETGTAYWVRKNGTPKRVRGPYDFGLAAYEARQSLDLRKDLARRVMPSDGPYQKGDRVFVWHKDESKKKSEGAWVRGIVVSQEGAMGLVEVHRTVLRVNQSKVRRDGDPWHDVAIPLKSDESRTSEPLEVREDAPIGSSQDETIERIGQKILDRASAKYCYEHEICYRSLTAGKSDLVEITPHLTGLTA
eukprot:s4190_g7.t1